LVAQGYGSLPTTVRERAWAKEAFPLLDKRNCPACQGGGDTYPLFPGENRVAVAAFWTMVKWGATRFVEVLLQSGPVPLFRLGKKSKSRKVRFAQSGGRWWRQVPLISRERTRRRRHLKMGDTAQVR